MRRFIPVAFALMLIAVACDNSGSDSSSTTSPSVPITTETFTGTVPVGGSDFKSFTVAQSGTVNVTLSAAGPPPTITMGLGVGTPSSTACALLSGGSTQTPAGTAPQLTGSLTPGPYCVLVGDIGNQLAPVDYTVTVAHP
jgi:hypothetical protein